jgi:phage tail sheath gpL-like
MPLSGISATDPTPGTRRELIFNAGSSLGAGVSRSIMLFGNKSSSGTETVETVGGPILSDQDFKDRFGGRSELYQMWRALLAANRTSRVYAIGVTDAAAGTAGTCTFTFVTAASAGTTVDVYWGGLQTSFSVVSGDAIATQATALAAAINNADQGTWPFTAVGALGVTTVTHSTVGDRAGLTLERIRVVYRANVTTVCTKSAVAEGTGTDDFTAALAAVSTAGTYYYHVSPKHALVAVTATDNGIGEHCTSIVTQALPVNGKNQIVCFGQVGTQAQGAAVTTSSSVNTVRARFFWAENNDYTPGMLAAHHAGVLQLGHEKHPNYNFTGYANDAATPYTVPPPFSRSDIPTSTEIVSALNAGMSPVTFNSLGAPSLVREITSKSLVAGTTTYDFRCREGNLTSAIDFAWDDVIAPQFAAQKQQSVAADPVPGGVPVANTMYPTAVRALLIDVINDLSGGNPLGRYNGPILNPETAAAQRDSIVVTKIPQGISASADLQAAEHYLRGEFTIRETSAAQ